MNYISISLYTKIINQALKEGLDRDFFKQLPTSIDSINHIQAVPADHFFELHELLDERLGPGFAVRAGHQMKIDDYGVLGLSWKTCSWAGEIFDRCERYFRLLSDTYVFKIEKNAALSKVCLFRDAYRRGVELSNEATFSATVVVLQAITASNIAPVEVGFKHNPPENRLSHDKAFKCPVLFHQPQNYITYKTRELEMRTVKADDSINKFLVERVEEETKGIEISPNRIALDVENLIKDALPSGIPGIQQIGYMMGMSNRTLTRRLAENGTSFRDLIKKTQLDVARNLLKNSSRSVAEIAFETGFSEQSAFNRAFRRWTGQSPVEFRKSL
ncbi:MAG: helix-turn-helix domain-containing protein [Candidatus Cyclobacteriaceae bacterium M3_2C_046]